MPDERNTARRPLRAETDCPLRGTDMDNGNVDGPRLAWAGIGRMGYALVTRLLEHGCDVAVYNRARSKAEPLAEVGTCTIVDSPVELADRDIVFTMVAGDDDFRELVLGPQGLLSDHGGPRIIVDSTTVSADVSEKVLAEKGGMTRAALFEFLNSSVMGSMFTGYKTPAYVNLDFHATFTPILLRKDFDLGFAAAREHDVPMPVAAATL